MVKKHWYCGAYIYKILICILGYLTEETLSVIYSQFFPLGNSVKFSKHLFGAIRFANDDSQSFKCFSDNNENKIYFKDFIGALSIITKGTIEERIRWVFNLYDLDKDGRINKEVRKTVFIIFRCCPLRILNW